MVHGRLDLAHAEVAFGQAGPGELNGTRVATAEAGHRVLLGGDAALELADPAPAQAAFSSQFSFAEMGDPGRIALVWSLGELLVCLSQHGGYLADGVPVGFMVLFCRADRQGVGAAQAERCVYTGRPAPVTEARVSQESVVLAIGLTEPVWA
ncbi:hypothetical protein [Nonomuraea sp. NPDC049784]|uniref:hypothetical protein n=1 Tax=Nonomuraea sp. NPDC049784 TaxID=3154361 RepID=UPI0033EF5AAF